MKNKIQFLLSSIMLGALMTQGALTMVQASNDANLIEIHIGGDPNTRFTATFEIHQDDEIIISKVEETVPRTYHYHGEMLNANVRQESEQGGLTVEIRKSGNVSRSSTRGMSSEMKLRVR